MAEKKTLWVILVEDSESGKTRAVAAFGDCRQAEARAKELQGINDQACHVFRNWQNRRDEWVHAELARVFSNARLAQLQPQERNDFYRERDALRFRLTQAYVQDYSPPPPNEDPVYYEVTEIDFTPGDENAS